MLGAFPFPHPGRSLVVENAAAGHILENMVEKYRNIFETMKNIRYCRYLHIFYIQGGPKK